MKATSLIESKYLKKDDVDPPISGTVRGLKKVNIGKEDGPEELKWALFLNESPKPLLLNSTNIQLLTHYLGGETDDWKGKAIELYNDPSISFGGKLTGGVRVRLPTGQAQPKATPAKESDGFDDDIPF